MEDDLVRRKRVNEEGEWEYECRVCELWLSKDDFRGCKNLVDAYGNCLMCKRCKGSETQITRLDNEKAAAEAILKAIGFSQKYSNSEEWWNDKRRLPWHRNRNIY